MSTGVLPLNRSVTAAGTANVVKFSTPSAKPSTGTFGKPTIVPPGSYVTMPSDRFKMIDVVPSGTVPGGNGPFAPVLPLLNCASSLLGASTAKTARANSTPLGTDRLFSLMAINPFPGTDRIPISRVRGLAGDRDVAAGRAAGGHPSMRLEYSRL
jgi:hypothetical protein